jgi:hypothetical protein
MIKIKDDRIYFNGFHDCVGLYSDRGMKIFDKLNGQPYDNTYDAPIAVPLFRYERGDYYETNEPVKIFEEVKDETNNNI